MPDKAAINATRQTEITFKAGDNIYNQGEVSKGAYLILSGQIDLFREDDGHESYIASLRDGELLGEIGALEGSPRSVTAKAALETHVLFIKAETFKENFSDPIVHHVVHTLAARLRTSYANQLDQDTSKELPSGDYPFIEGQSRAVADKLLTYAEIKSTPFTIGNLPPGDEKIQISPASLKVQVKRSPSFLGAHMDIIKRNGKYYVRDLGSPQGTIVNGGRVKKYEASAIAKLHTGKNIVIAGAENSLVRFIVTVPDV